MSSKEKIKRWALKVLERGQDGLDDLFKELENVGFSPPRQVPPKGKVAMFLSNSCGWCADVSTGEINAEGEVLTEAGAYADWRPLKEEEIWRPDEDQEFPDESSYYGRCSLGIKGDPPKDKVQAEPKRGVSCGFTREILEVMMSHPRTVFSSSDLHCMLKEIPRSRISELLWKQWKVGRLTRVSTGKYKISKFFLKEIKNK